MQILKLKLDFENTSQWNNFLYFLFERQNALYS